MSLVSAFEDILFACIQLPDASAPKACCYLVNLPKSTFALAVQLNPKLLHSLPHAKEVFSVSFLRFIRDAPLTMVIDKLEHRFI